MNEQVTIPTEAQEQTALFQWAEMMQGRIPELRLMHHIANGGTRNQIEAVHLKQQGVKPGIPDIFLPCARGAVSRPVYRNEAPDGRAGIGRPAADDPGAPGAGVQGGSVPGLGRSAGHDMRLLAG